MREKKDGVGNHRTRVMGLEEKWIALPGGDSMEWNGMEWFGGVLLRYRILDFER